ncbi:putative transcription factor interactor and regulator CCHC(Zn) family [Medicago truncatula]|nr:putative transcription factor interactor and regulator CCHC(Zn) family [Medicago truncatula]
MLSEVGRKGKGPYIENVENAVEFISNPPRSITKGRPKTKRSKGGIELSREARSCSFCNRSGHNVTTCPDKEGYVPSSTIKKRKNEAQATKFKSYFIFKILVKFFELYHEITTKKSGHS